MTNFKNIKLAGLPVKKAALQKNGFSKSIVPAEDSLLTTNFNPASPTLPANECNATVSPNTGETITNSVDKLMMIMNASLDAIICIDIEGIITFWNPKAAEIFGWTETEALSKPLAELIIPEKYRSRHHQGIADYLKTGKGPALNKLLELSAINRNAKEFPIELTIIPIKQGGTEFFCAYIRDITGRKLAEERLKLSEAGLIEAQKVAKVGSWETDLLSLKVIWSEETYRIFDIDPAMFKESHPGFLEFVHPEDRAKVDAAFVSSMDGYSINTIEHRILTNSGLTKVLEERWQIIRNAQGQPAKAVGTCRDITEYKRSEAALQKTNEEKNTILERIDDGFFAVDNNSIVTYWNKRAEILLNAKREDVIGKNLHEIFATPASIAFYNNYQKAITENSTVHFEEFSKRTNKWFAVSAYASEKGLTVYFKDVTESKKTHILLKESEAKYRAFFESSMDGILLTVTDGEILSANPAACEIFKMTEEEICAAGRFGIVDLTDPRVNLLLEERRHTGRVKGELTLLRKDGSKFQAELTSAVFTDSFGQDRTSMIVRDITERKKAEYKLRESELRYRSIIEQATDAICIADASMKIMDVNPYCCQLLGYSKEEFMQLSINNFFLPEDLKAEPFKIEELKSGKIVRNERRFKRKDGTIVEVELSARILEDGRFIVFGHDVSESKKAAQLIIASEAKYRTLFEQNMAGVYQTTEKGVILNCNNAFAKMLKYDSPAELLKINASKLYFSVAERNNFINYAITQKNIHNYESILKCKDGSPLYFIENISLQKDDTTGEDIFNGIMIDITEKKQAELRLKESNERYNLVSQATNDMVWDWDLVTGKVYRNKEGWKKIFRTGDREIEIESMHDWDDRIHPEDLQKVKLVYEEMLKSVKDFFEVECRVHRDDGTYAYIHDRGNIMRDNEGNAIRLIGATQDITERKEAELQVIKSEVRFRSLVQNGSDLISVMDERGYYLYISPAVKQMLGYDPEFIIGKNAFAYMHHEDIILAKAHLNKMGNETSFDMPSFRIKNTDGEWRWLESKVTNLCDNAEIQGYVFNSRDITEKKIAEEEINKLSIIARETGNAVIITNPEGEIVWVNEGFTTITEFESEDVIGKKPGDFLQGEETNLAVVRFMRNNIKKIKPFECDIVNYAKSGRKYWLRIQCQPQFDETGQLKYFFAIETDITKEKEAEVILKASEERYRYLFNNNPANIFIWDINNFQILEVNDTAVKLYGYYRKEFLTKTVMDISQPEDHEKVRQFALKIRQKSDFKFDNTCKHINKAGERMYMNISSHLIEFKGRSVILALATDITDKVILEHELEQERNLKHKEITEAVISAQEQERQELGGELHDNVNQILAGSLLYLGLAKKELKLDHPYLKETDILINTAIEEIRNLSHSLIPPSLNESEFLEALNHIIEVTQKTTGIIISLQAFGFNESSIPDKLKLSIYRIVQEQFNNILKHAGAQKIIVRLVQENEKTLLSVKDDGKGFDTTKKANGVGLLNIKTRASLFNGDMSIISSPGKGCELRVLFN